MKRFMLSLAFLMLFMTDQIFGSVTYNTYQLDTTANGGTGFGNATPGSATGYTSSTFLSGFPLQGYACAVQPDGKIVVAGSDFITGSPSLTKAVVARYNIDGTLDTTFNGVGYQTQVGTSSTFSTNNNVTLTDILVQPDGGIVAVGYTTPQGGGTQSLLVWRLTAAGVADTTFNNGGTQGYVVLNLGTYIQTNASGTPTTTSVDLANAVALDGSGNIFVTGTTTISQFAPTLTRIPPVVTQNIFAVKFNSSGVLQTSFNTGAVVGGTNSSIVVTASGIALISMSSATNLAANGMRLDASGKLVMVGSSTNSGVTQMFVARMLNTGVVDTTFNSVGYMSTNISSPTVGYDVAFQSTGRIIVAGSINGAAVAVGVTSAGALDTTFGSILEGSIANGYYAAAWTGTTPIARGVEVQSDDMIILGGTTNSSGGSSDFIIDVIVANGSSDLSFQRTSISNPNFGGSIAMQQNGSIVQVGTVGTGNTQIGIARYLGVPVEGAMNLYYNPSASNPGYCVYPTSSTPADMPKVVAIYPLPHGEAYVLTTDPGDSFAQVNVIGVDGTRGTPCNINNSGTDYPTVFDVIADSLGRAIVVGKKTDTTGFIARYINNNGVMELDTSFGVSGFQTLLNSTNISFARVTQLSTGSYLAAYNPGGFGAVSSISEDGLIQEGLHFNQSATALSDLIVDSDDNFYITGIILGKPNYLIYKCNVTSDTGDATFGNAYDFPGLLDTGIAVSSHGLPCLSFDNDGNVVIGVASTSSDLFFQNNSSYNGAVLASGTITQATNLLSTPVLKKLQCDTYGTYGRLVYTGYDNNNFIVGRMVRGGMGNSSYLIDTTFAPYSTCPGILKTNYNDKNPTNTASLTQPYRFSNTVCISTEGALLFGGYENITSTSTVSLVGQSINAIAENPVPTQVNRFPGTPKPDGKLAPNTPLDLYTTTFGALEGQPQAIYVFGSGTFNGYTLVVTTDGTTAQLSMLDATTYALNTNDDETMFADGDGYIVLNDLLNATSVFVAVDGSIYVLGTDNTTDHSVVIVKVSADGTTQSSIYPSFVYNDIQYPVFTSAYQIVQQASGRILICGYNSSIDEGPGTGIICALTPSNDLDISFAPNSYIPGCFLVGPNSFPVMSIAVGETGNTYYDADMIYIAAAVYSEGVYYAGVARLLENGTQFDPYFDVAGVSIGNFISNVIAPTQIRMQINEVDSDGYVNVVANTATGIQAVRYDRSNGAIDTTQFVIIPSALTPTLQEVLCLSDGTTLILSSNGQTLDLARLTSAFAADPDFNAGGTYTGVLNTTVPATSPTQAEFWAMDVLGDGGMGIIIASDNNVDPVEANPYLTQVVNSTALTKYPQTASSLGTPGIVDGTFNTTGVFPGSLNVSSELSDSSDSEIVVNFPQDAVVTALLQIQEVTPIYMPNGWYYIGGSDSMNSYVALMSDDDVLQDGEMFDEFADNGLLTLTGLDGLTAMTIAQDETLWIVGTGSSAWVTCRDGYDGSELFSTTTPLTSHRAIAQQTNGRMLIAGDFEGVAAIVACNSVTGEVDTTFADNGVFTLTGYGAINSILTDDFDTIYVIANSVGNFTYVFSLNSTATEVNWQSTTLAGNATLSENNHLTFDRNNNIVAIAVNTQTTGIILVATLGLNGVLIGTPSSLNNATTGLSQPNVSSVAVDLSVSPGKLVLAGFQTGSPAIPFVMRLESQLIEDEPTYVLDTTFYAGSGTQGVVTTRAFGGDTMVKWYDAMINLNGKITVGGFGTDGDDNYPYLVRFYGDEFIGQYEVYEIAGTPGTLNYNFPDDNPESPTAGYLDLDVETTGTPVCVVPLPNGSQYVGFSDGTIVRYTNENILDQDFGPATPGYAAATVPGISDMIVDGNGCLVVVGTFNEQGWIVRYENGNSGEFDPTFNHGNGILPIQNCFAANRVLEQSLARLIVVGQLNINDGSNVNGALFALTDTGVADATFSIYSDSGVGVADSEIPLPLYACVADQYDRLLVAGIYDEDGSVGISRLTSSAEYDYSFGEDYEAIIFNALPDVVNYGNVANLAQIHVVLDANDNVVVAANTVAGIEIAAYPNSTDVTDPSIDVFSFGGMDPLLDTPTLIGMVATQDGKVLLCGNQAPGLPMWVARLYNNADVYDLDPEFAPDSTTPGIMFFNIAQNECYLAPIAIYGTGEITMVGYDYYDDVIAFFMSRAYNNPYVPAVPMCLDSLPQGAVDQTFGVTNNDGNNGITFWAYDDESGDQSAKAIGLYDDDNLVIALDGTREDSGSQIYINMFNVDGLLAQGSYPDEPYQELVLNEYDNQYVDDMIVFTTVDNVTKAILAGYARNNTPYLTSSLLLCYNLDETELDESFGGYNGTIPGVAFGDVRKLHAVGLQSNGRIIAGGTDYYHNGVVVGYTSMGKMDQSFGQGGAFLQGECGIHATIIDAQDRIVIAYNNAGEPNYLAIARILPDGSALDASFGVDGVLTTSMQLADGNRKNFGIAFDTDGNIVVAAGNATDDGLNLAMYDASGTIVGTVAAIAGMSLNDYTITQVLVDQSDAVVVVGRDIATEYYDQVVVARFVYGALSHYYGLDNTFNNGTGFVKYQVQHGDEQSTCKAMIHPDGRIIVTGNQSEIA